MAVILKFPTGKDNPNKDKTYQGDAQIFPFPNRAFLLELIGKEMLEALEEAQAISERWQAGVKYSAFVDIQDVNDWTS